MPRCAATFCIAFGALAFTGCSVDIGRSGSQQPVHAKGGPPPHAPAHGYRRKFSYQYYPDAQVYFRAESGTWFWLETDGWKVGVQLPDRIRIGLGESVALDLDTDRPYEQHGKVAKDHPGRGRRASAGKR